MFFIKHTLQEPQNTEEFTADKVLTLSASQISQQLTRELEGVDQRFNLATDPDMIDAYIFERAALVARLRQLLRIERQGESIYPLPPRPVADTRTKVETR